MAAASIRTNWLCSTTVKHEERTERRLIRSTFKVYRLWKKSGCPVGGNTAWSIEGKEIPNHNN
jgi:hypothetical protein